MATKTRNISLPPELDEAINQRVKSGLYGNSSDVIRAGLRALAREELGASLKQFEEIMSVLPQDPVTPEIEQEIERKVRAARRAELGKIQK